MSTKETISVEVELDVNNVPEKLAWKATGGPETEAQSCKAALLSIWDPKESEALRIDLWTKDMPADDMKKFFHQTFATMADTFDRATNEAALAQEIRDFSLYFAQKAKLLSPKEG